MGGPAETAATSGQIDFQRVMNRSSEIKLTCNESPALILSSFCLCSLETSSQPVHIPQPSRCRHKRSASPAPASATKETVTAVFQLLSPFINGRKNQQTSEKVRTSSRRPSDSRHRSHRPITLHHNFKPTTADTSTSSMKSAPPAAALAVKCGRSILFSLVSPQRTKMSRRVKKQTYSRSSERGGGRSLFR